MVLPIITSENDFAFLRPMVLNKPTIPEYQLIYLIIHYTLDLLIYFQNTDHQPLIRDKVGPFFVC
jgi:hypothetical protein